MRVRRAQRSRRGFDARQYEQPAPRPATTPSAQTMSGSAAVATATPAVRPDPVPVDADITSQPTGWSVTTLQSGDHKIRLRPTVPPRVAGLPRRGGPALHPPAGLLGPGPSCLRSGCAAGIQLRERRSPAQDQRDVLRAILGRTEVWQLRMFVSSIGNTVGTDGPCSRA